MMCTQKEVLLRVATSVYLIRKRIEINLLILTPSTSDINTL